MLLSYLVELELVIMIQKPVHPTYSVILRGNYSAT